MLHFVLKTAIEETKKKKFLRFVQPILETKVLIAEQLLLICPLMSVDITVVVEVDGGGYEPHMLRPQLHSVANQFDLAPEFLVEDRAQEEVFLLVA